MRKKLRLLHHPISTERAYLGWIRRFISHVGNEELSKCGTEEVTEFLSELALLGEVAASTQNQAFNALLFYYRMVLARELGSVDALLACVSYVDLNPIRAALPECLRLAILGPLRMIGLV